MSENEELEKTPQASEQVSEQASPPASPMTQEQFSAQLTQLTERAREAGLRPVHAMLATYLKLGTTMLDKLLEGLDTVDSPKKKE
jgi:hypothetical protein